MHQVLAIVLLMLCWLLFGLNSELIAIAIATHLVLVDDDVARRKRHHFRHVVVLPQSVRRQ